MGPSFYCVCMHEETHVSWPHDAMSVCPMIRGHLVDIVLCMRYVARFHEIECAKSRFLSHWKTRGSQNADIVPLFSIQLPPDAVPYTSSRVKKNK